MTCHEEWRIMLRTIICVIGRWIQGYLEKGTQTPVAQGRSTNWLTRTRRLSTNISLSCAPSPALQGYLAHKKQPPTPGPP